MAQYELNLQDYLRIIRKRIWIILFSFLVVLIPSWWWSSKPKPIYSASTDISVEERRTPTSAIKELISYSTGDPVETKVQIIRKSEKILGKTAIALGYLDELLREQLEGKDIEEIKERIIRRWDLSELKDRLNLDGRSYRRIKEELNRRVAYLQGVISTKRGGRTNIITITATTQDSESCAQIANRLAEVYREEDYREKYGNIEDAYEYAQVMRDRAAERLVKVRRI